MRRAQGRINPAWPDAEIRKWRRQLDYAVDLADSVATVGNTTEGPISGTGDRVYLDLDDPDIIVYVSQSDDASDIITYPVSTLMVPDATDPDVLTFPTL